jgi:dephospho-CoA kinase
MLSVGLTGGIASGKSLAAQLFVQKGARLIDADLVARDIVRPGEEGFQPVLDAFGCDIITLSGELDRAKLGTIVFADPVKRKLLDTILHPLILNRIFSHIAHLNDQRYQGIVVVDIPLLFECGLQEGFDKTVLVYATPEMQQQRLMQRNSITPEAARQRLCSQMALDDKRQYADYIIENTGSVDALEGRVAVVWSSLCGILQKGDKIS